MNRREKRDRVDVTNIITSLDMNPHASSTTIVHAVALAIIGTILIWLLLTVTSVGFMTR
jgi:hypothetical protein